MSLKRQHSHGRVNGLTPRRRAGLRQLAKPLALLATAFLILPGWAAPGTALSVKALIDRSAILDRTVVSVRGTLSVAEHGLINLHSRNKDECVGLLLTQADMDKYASWDRRDVLVTGTLESEGCGRDGFCDEHLCGPAILTGVTIRRPGSPPAAIAS